MKAHLYKAKQFNTNRSVSIPFKVAEIEFPFPFQFVISCIFVNC